MFCTSKQTKSNSPTVTTKKNRQIDSFISKIPVIWAVIYLAFKFFKRIAQIKKLTGREQN
jgi:hypothetical protein